MCILCILGILTMCILVVLLHISCLTVDLSLTRPQLQPDLVPPCACSELNLRRRAAASEEESRKAQQAQQEADGERRLAERERQERTAECLSWREKHQELAARVRAQDDLKALRQNKAVRGGREGWMDG